MRYARLGFGAGAEASALGTAAADALAVVTTGATDSGGAFARGGSPPHAQSQHVIVSNEAKRIVGMGRLSGSGCTGQRPPTSFAALLRLNSLGKSRLVIGT
jgi:hypothetical protein